MTVNFGRRFVELCQQADVIEAGRVMQVLQYSHSGYRVDANALLNWIVKVRHLISSVCGEQSQHFLKFVECEKPGVMKLNYDMFLNMKAVLLAAKEDYEGGYINKIRNLIQADVFDSELEQAIELLSAGYSTAAAVVAGVVLETTLRQMCEDKHLVLSKLDKMGADLAKAGVFSKLVQKQITAWADIRNSAAHGNVSQFAEKDVEAMIRDIGRFVAEQLA